jgi:hypothetical protein
VLGELAIGRIVEKSFVNKIHWAVTCPFTADKESAIEESVLSAYMTENKLEKTFAIPAVIASLPLALHEQIVLDHVDRFPGCSRRAMAQNYLCFPNHRHGVSRTCTDHRPSSKSSKFFGSLLGAVNAAHETKNHV